MTLVPAVTDSRIVTYLITDVSVVQNAIGAELIMTNNVRVETKFLHDGFHYLRRRLPRRAGIDGETTGVAIRVQLAEDGVAQPLALANVLEQARAHAAAEQRVEHVGGVAPLVADGMRRHADANL